MRIKLALIVSFMATSAGVVGLPVAALSSSAAHLAPLVSTWTDNFDALALDSRWSWIYEDPTHWSLAAHPGFLRIATQQESRNLLVQNTPVGDFEIQTRVLFTPTENFQQAGLLIYGDDANQLTLKRGYCGNPPPECVGNGIYFDHLMGGSLVGSNFAMTMPIQGEAYLRLVRKGNVFTGLVSTDGMSWTLVGTHTADFRAPKIGLSAGNFTSATEIPADFDFFRLDDNAYRVLLPLVIGN